IADIWTDRLASSTTTPGQAASSSSDLETYWFGRSRRTCSMRTARGPRPVGKSPRVNDPTATSSRNEPKQYAVCMCCVARDRPVSAIAHCPLILQESPQRGNEPGQAYPLPSHAHGPFDDNERTTLDR